MNIFIQNNELIINEQRVSLPFHSRPKKCLLYKNHIIVLVNVNYLPNKNRNIFALDLYGNYLWTIQELEFNSPNRYTGIWVNDEDQLIAATWIGVDVLIDHESGNITVQKGGRPW